MKIEALLGYKDVGDGVRLPEYLLRVSHREVMMLGASRFEVGEILSTHYFIDKLESHIRTLSLLHKTLEYVEAKG